MSTHATLTYQAHAEEVWAASASLIRQAGYVVHKYEEPKKKILYSTPREGLWLPPQIAEMLVIEQGQRCQLTLWIESAVAPGNWLERLYQRKLLRFVMRHLERSFTPVLGE